jgi:hypothetical protein
MGVHDPSFTCPQAGRGGQLSGYANERADRVRAEGRAWSIQDRNFDKRASTYRDLIVSAEAITRCIGAYATLRCASYLSEGMRRILEEFSSDETRNAQFERLRAAIADTIFVAIDQSVPETAKHLDGRARDSFLLIHEDDSDDTIGADGIRSRHPERQVIQGIIAGQV